MNPSTIDASKFYVRMVGIETTLGQIVRRTTAKGKGGLWKTVCNKRKLQDGLKLLQESYVVAKRSDEKKLVTNPENKLVLRALKSLRDRQEVKGLTVVVLARYITALTLLINDIDFEVSVVRGDIRKVRHFFKEVIELANNDEIQ
jgi:hypothetical protein